MIFCARLWLLAVLVTTDLEVSLLFISCYSSKKLTCFSFGHKDLKTHSKLKRINTKTFLADESKF